MCRWRIELLLPLFILAVWNSCGFVDLRPIEVRTVPGEAYGVLPESYSPVFVHFDTEMLRTETESVIKIISPLSSVETDIEWQGNNLVLKPVSSWIAGVRYVLRLSGTVYSRDGRDLFLSKEIPFFAISSSPMPYLKSVFPSDGESTEVFYKDDIVLEFIFSESMDRRSTEAALSCDSMGDKIYEWLDNDCVLQVITGKPLSPWTSYRWSLSEKALSREGAPLAKSISGRFITDMDDNFPQVLKIIPLLKSETPGDWGYWIPLDLNLERGLGPNQGIGVEFNKPMDGETIRRAFSFEPSLPGRVDQLSATRAVYIPERNPEVETNYTLKISGDIKDIGGLKMGKDKVLFFSSDIPQLKINSIYSAGDVVVLKPERGMVIKTCIDEAGGGVLRFTIHFSLPFKEEVQNEEAFRITLEPFFPGNLPPVNLRFVRWPYTDQIHMDWEGLQIGKPGESHYYRLVLPGGRNGMENGDGSYFKEENWFFIEVVGNEG